MSYHKNRQPIRQLSLQTDDRRKLLKTQLSEDLSEFNQISEYRVSLPSRKQSAIADKPPPAKLAWIDNNQKQEKNLNKNEEGIVAKKCKEIKRPNTSKLIKQTSLPKESILLSHQQLAERLRQAWKEREKSKQNLKIFLAQNVREKLDDEPTNTEVDSESIFMSEPHNPFDKLANKPKMLLPLNPQTLPAHEIDYKSIFQKRLRRTHSIDEQNVYSPSRTDLKKTVVIVPFNELQNYTPTKPEVSTSNLNTEKTENQMPKIDQQLQDVKIEEKLTNAQEERSYISEESSNKHIDVVIRPMTANAKRDGFRSRTNSAFNGVSPTPTNFRPPLVRASSVPLKPSQPKTKFLTAKRRVKSACKRKDKNEKDETVQKYICEDNEAQCKKYERSVSFSGTEIITMVSLISPEESETEERVETEIEKENPKTDSIIKPDVEKQEKLQNAKTLTLRKTVKSVSFQQSTIHAVRSFSASFPARRGSVATNLLVNNDGASGRSSYGNAQEKRGTAENMPNEAREPKRRLLRSKSTTSEQSSDKSKEKNETENCQTQESKNATSVTKSNPVETNETNNEKPTPNEVESQQNEAPKSTFENAKEKQCWDAFCKMNKKGLNVSFDTILRGMLTPTEYRLRRKSIATIVGETEDQTINDT